jgi:metallo-beta-lactamase class B
MLRSLAALSLAVLTLPAAADEMQDQIAAWNKPFAPFRLLGNLYYVGTADLASFLIVTPDGLALVDSGVEKGADQILAGIRKLGFDPKDLKLIVNTQAHFDHAAGFAALKQASGGHARLAVGAEDADLLENGGKGDFLWGDQFPMAPVTVDVRVKDGDALTVGGTTLVAHATHGHTRGATTWTTTIRDAGRDYKVMFTASTTVNPGQKILGMPGYPDMLQDFERTFMALKTLPCEVFLGQHAGFYGLQEKRAKLKDGAPNPFVDPQACKDGVAGMEERFRKALAEERAGH